MRDFFENAITVCTLSFLHLWCRSSYHFITFPLHCAILVRSWSSCRPPTESEPRVGCRGLPPLSHLPFSRIWQLTNCSCTDSRVRWHQKDQRVDKSPRAVRSPRGQLNSNSLTDSKTRGFFDLSVTSMVKLMSFHMINFCDCGKLWHQWYINFYIDVNVTVKQCFPPGQWTAIWHQ